MKNVFMMAVGWSVTFIAYGSFMVNGRHTKIEEWLISHIIANTFSNFFVPLYYIYIPHLIFANMLKSTFAYGSCNYEYHDQIFNSIETIFKVPKYPNINIYKCAKKRIFHYVYASHI